MREDFKENQATWSCAKENLECFVFEKKSSFFFKNFPHFFSSKNTTCLSILILTLWNTTLNNTREFFILKNICKKKNGKNIWGEKFIISNQSFLFSKFSIQCQPFPPFGCARFWPPPQFREPKKWLLFFLLSVLLIPLLKFGMWLFQFPPHF